MKKRLYEQLIISPKENDRYILLEDFFYKDVKVPKGYCTNGANIPRILWAVWPPNRSDYLPAVVLHDYLCDAEQYSKADEYFKEMLQVLEVSKITIFCFYNATRLYHKIRYSKYK